MKCAKIDSNGDIIEYPYPGFNYTEQLLLVQAGIQAEVEIPDNIVEVDPQYYKPELAWDEKEVEGTPLKELDDEGNTVYRASYTKEKILTRLKERITELKRQHTTYNENALSSSLEQIKQALFIKEDMVSWQNRRTEAERYTADNSASTPILSAVASARGLTLQEVVDDVLSQAAEYDSKYGTIIGQYQSNRLVLMSVSPEDSTTWDNINNFQEFTV